MQMYNMREEQSLYYDERTVARLVNGVFMWMFAGILLTALTVFGVFAVPGMKRIVAESYYGILIAQVVIALVMGFLINKLTPTVAKGLYILYTVLTGLTFSIIALMYNMETIVFSLGLTAAIFGVMAVYGYKTQEDLSKFGPILSVSLIVLIIGGVMNLFLHLPMMSLILAYAGVLIFTALIGYDVNRIKAGMIHASAYGAGGAQLEKFAIIGAFNIYLDFVNLFLSILRILGGRR